MKKALLYALSIGYDEKKSIRIPMSDVATAIAKKPAAFRTEIASPVYFSDVSSFATDHARMNDVFVNPSRRKILLIAPGPSGC